MDADQLKEVLRLHQLWLEDADGGVKANLRYANLSSADLRSADLRFANLRFANLSSADLSSADLRFANLRSASVGGEHGGIEPESIGLPPATDDFLRLVCQAAIADDALNMGSWHTCETQHCLAGWAIHLAGPAGYALEKATSPSVAGSLLVPKAAHLFYADADTAKSFCRSVVDGEAVATT